MEDATAPVPFAEQTWVVLPPGPRCARCGHVVCPCCLTWCDTLQDTEHSWLCCGGECELDQEAVNRWVESWPAGAYFPPVTLIVAEGPALP